MTVENLSSGAINGLDSLTFGTLAPIIYPTAGEGAPGILRRLTDTVTVTAAGMASAGSAGTDGSFYRLCRFPTGARLKALRVDLGIVDSGGATAVFDINVAFSDSLNDNTPSIYTTAGEGIRLQPRPVSRRTRRTARSLRRTPTSTRTSCSAR